jgi:general secretion pathway protein L
MPDRLLLRLSPAGDPTWIRRTGDGRTPEASRRGWPAEKAVAEAAEIVVLVPAEDALVTAARVAARNRAQLMQAVPFAIEDQLLAPVEELAFAASEITDGDVGVAVVAKAKLREWIEVLGSHGIRPDVLLPESLALPSVPDRAAALIEDDRAIVRFGPWSAFTCAPAELAAWLACANGADAPRPIEVHDFRDATPLALPAAASYAARQRDPLAFLARHLVKPVLNFLHGEFAPRHRAARGARLWRIAAALAAAVLVLALANLGFEVVQLARTSARMDQLTGEALRKAFPDVSAAELARSTPAEIARARIERLRGGAQGAGGFLRVVGKIAPVLGSTTRIQTRAMEYRNGALELGLRAPDVATLDAVRERLAALPGLKVAVTAANPGDDGIDGRVRIGIEAGGGAR